MIGYENKSRYQSSQDRAVLAHTSSRCRSTMCRRRCAMARPSHVVKESHKTGRKVGPAESGIALSLFGRVRLRFGDKLLTPAVYDGVSDGFANGLVSHCPLEMINRVFVLFGEFPLHCFCDAGRIDRPSHSRNHILDDFQAIQNQHLCCALRNVIQLFRTHQKKVFPGNLGYTFKPLLLPLIKHSLFSVIFQKIFQTEWLTIARE